MKINNRFPNQMSVAMLVAVLSIFAVGLFFIHTSARESLIRFEAREPGLATDDDKLLVALPLFNLGGVTALNVRIARVRLGDQQLVKPAELPLSLGMIPAGKDAIVQLAFRSEGLVADTRYTLRLEGTCLASRSEERFQVEQEITLPQPEEGERAAGSATVAPQRFEGGDFPPKRLENYPKKANEFEGRPLPEGKPIETIRPDNPSVEIAQLPSSAAEGFKPGPQLANDPVTFLRAGTKVMGNLPVLEPSGASVDVPTNDTQGPGVTRVVLLTGNGPNLLLSTDGGATYSKANGNTVFPDIPADPLFPPGIKPDAGFGCDQNVIYIPSINCFVWQLLSYGSPGVIFDKEGGFTFNGYNRMRIAVASPQQLISNGTVSFRERYWDVTTKTFGFTDTANHKYWDAGTINGEDYSYARYMAAQCYSVLAIDRLGAGESSKPDGDYLDKEKNADSIAQVLTSLRTHHNPTGRKFKRVVLVGHSLGTFSGIYALGTYGNIADAFVATGWVTAPGVVPLDTDFVEAALAYPYIVFPSEVRAALFYATEPIPPVADPDVIAFDNASLADQFSRGFFLDTIEVLGARAAGDMDVIKSLTRVDQVAVPVFIQLGDFDILAPSSLIEQEADMFTGAPSVTANALTNIGHCYNLHLTRIAGWQAIADWIGDTLEL